MKIIPRPHPWLFRAALVPIAGLSAFLVLRTSHAAPTPATPIAIVEPRNMEIEVIDQAKDKNSDVTRFTLSLADGGRAGFMTVPIGALQYSLNARCDPSNGTSSIPVTVSVRRRDSHPGGPAEVTMDLTTVVARNTKTSLGTIVRPDGSRTEVTVKVR